MTVILANCNGNTKPTSAPPVGGGNRVTPLAGTNVVRPTLKYTDPARTAVPYGPPTLAAEIGNTTKFVDAAPPFVGRWALDKKKSYINQQFPGGAVLIYNAPGLGDIQISYWLIYVADIPDYNVNNAIDRFNLETSLVTVLKTPVSIGDRALICTANRRAGEKTGANPTLLAILQWRNIVIDVYATPDLLKSNFDFSDAEATEFLTKMFNAIPKP
jgi:hypothetical protein